MSFLLILLGRRVPQISTYGWLFGFDVAVVAASFILLGYLLRRYVIDKLKNRRKAFCLIGMLIIAGFIANVLRDIIPIQSAHMHRAGYTESQTFLAFFINAWIGILTTIFGAIFLDIVFKKVVSLNKIGKNTLGILVVHKPIVYYFAALISAYGYSCNNPCIALPIGIVICLISLGITIVIEKLMPEIVGKAKWR